MVNLEYVIESDCKPTAISLFFRGRHSSIIPDPCPWAFSYNQILFWRRYLFSLASSQQLASVWDLANETHRSYSPNVSHGRSPGPFPSQPPPQEFGSGSAGLSSLGSLQVAGHEPAWIQRELNSIFQAACSHVHFAGNTACTVSTECHMARSPPGLHSESCMWSLTPLTPFPSCSFFPPPSPSPYGHMCLSIRQI